MPDEAGALDGATLRANPRYRLILLDRLPRSDQARVRDADGDSEVYGVLRPKPGSRLEWRSVCSETALLFLTLTEPGPLPNYVVIRLGHDAERTVGRLVLDGVLEIEHEGQYLSGARAAAVVTPSRSHGGRGRIGELSRAALRYGQDLTGLPEPELATRLYCYGRRPLSPELQGRVGSDVMVGAYLGVTPGGAAAKALDSGWFELPPSGGQRSHWRRWRPRLASPAGATYKLYVSPATDRLAVAIEAVASSLAGAPGVSGMKFGSGLAGLCRPDKIVVHFDRLEDLHSAAAVLRDRLADCPAHGVPFTAAITDDGLLSWGADPLPASAAFGSARSSWRSWVTGRLAAYLRLAGRAEPAVLEPWQSALERLRSDGIDTNNWMLASGRWPSRS